MDEWDMTFVIDHCPHPYTRTTRKQKWVDARWRTYLASRDKIREQVEDQMRLKRYTAYETREHLSVHITIFTGRLNYNNVDLDNIAKGIIDALQHLVFPNDAWIDELYAIRAMSNPGDELVVVKIRQRTKRWFPRYAMFNLGRRLEVTGKGWLRDLSKLIRGFQWPSSG